MEITFIPGSNSTYAWVRVKMHVNGKEHEIDFSRDTGCKLGLDLLIETLDNKFHKELENLRRNEYEAGYKDGRGKRGRRTFFAGFLSWRQRNV